MWNQVRAPRVAARPHRISPIGGGIPRVVLSQATRSEENLGVGLTGAVPIGNSHIRTLHCCVQYDSRNNYSVVYSRGSRNSVNPRMSLCPARVWFRDSANVSPSSAEIPKRKPIRWSPKWIKIQFSWGTKRWLMDRYPLHRQFILAHGKLMPVKLGCRRIDLLTGFRHWVRFIFYFLESTFHL